MRNRPVTLGSYFLAAVGGGLTPLGLAPFDLLPLTVIGLATLAWLLYRYPRANYLLSFIFGTGLYLVGSSWVYVSIVNFGTLPAPLAALATLGFALFVAIFFALPFALLPRLHRNSSQFVSAFALIWLLGEWLRSWWLTGFPWLYSGYSLTDSWLASYAAVGGVYLLSALLAAAAATLALLSQLTPKQRRLHLLGAAAVVLFALPLDRIEWTQAEGDRLSVALVQPDVDQSIKWSRAARLAILQKLESASESLWGHDLIVWPEAAVPAIAQSVPEFLSRMDQRAHAEQSALITGIPNYQRRTDSYYNSMLGLGQAEGLYNKVQLVPFAEYIPLQSLLGPLLAIFELPMESMAYGNRQQAPLSLNQLKLAPAICYEIAYPDLVARQARSSGVVLTVSNDAWFNHTIAPKQHLQMAQLRAREVGKPVIRATNNGISALIGRRGELLAEAPQYQFATLSGSVQPRSGTTPFGRTGAAPWVIAALLICAILAWRNRRIAK